MVNFVKVAKKQDVPKGEASLVRVNGTDIALFNVNDQFYALNDNCPHMGGCISKGKIEGTIVTCPWHGAKFDITTGAVTGDPSLKKVVSYQVRVDGDDVKLGVSS